MVAVAGVKELQCAVSYCDINPPGMRGDCLSCALRSYERKFASRYIIPVLIVSMVADNEDSLFYDNRGTVI